MSALATFVTETEECLGIDAKQAYRKTCMWG